MKLGLRIIKTVLAVALCFIIDIFRGGMPFFAVIAAILCLQKEKKKPIPRPLVEHWGPLLVVYLACCVFFFSSMLILPTKAPYM